MKIGMDFRPALLSGTGFGRYTFELARALARLDGVGNDFELKLFGDAYHPVFHPERAAAVAGPRATLKRLPIPGRLTHLLGPLGYGVDLRLGGVDVFHFTDLIFPPVRRAPTVITIHDLSFDVDSGFHGAEFGRTVRARLAAPFARASRFIVPAAETRDQLADRHRIPRERISVIPYGAEHFSAVAPLPQQEAAELRARSGIGERYALCVGTIEPRKNHARLLRAFERVGKDRDLHLVVVGKFGWLFDEVKELLERLRAGGRVHHLENATDAQLRSLYDGALFAVYPSHYEGFGFPVVEAMALGLPVITTRGGALAEVAGGAARICDPLDVDSIAAALDEFASDDAERGRFAALGRERAAAFTWRRCAELHLDAYRRAAK